MPHGHAVAHTNNSRGDRIVKKDSGLVFAGHYVKVEGELVKIDPIKTDLPDRCKLALAEMVTGQKCSFIEPE